MFYLEENISLKMKKIRYNGGFYLMWYNHIQGNKLIVIYETNLNL